jgi:hypothetical protein
VYYDPRGLFTASATPASLADIRPARPKRIGRASLGINADALATTRADCTHHSSNKHAAPANDSLGLQQQHQCLVCVAEAAFTFDGVALALDDKIYEHSYLSHSCRSESAAARSLPLFPARAPVGALVGALASVPVPVSASPLALASTLISVSPLVSASASVSTIAVTTTASVTASASASASASETRADDIASALAVAARASHEVATAAVDAARAARACVIEDAGCAFSGFKRSRVSLQSEPFLHAWPPMRVPVRLPASERVSTGPLTVAEPWRVAREAAAVLAQTMPGPSRPAPLHSAPFVLTGLVHVASVTCLTRAKRSASVLHNSCAWPSREDTLQCSGVTLLQGSGASELLSGSAIDPDAPNTSWSAQLSANTAAGARHFAFRL